MTTPALAVSTDFGRLYRKPGTNLDAALNIVTAVAQGTLMPSVTNVIDVLNKPYLNAWHAKEAAIAAVNVNARFPGLVEAKPREATAWLKEAANRKAAAAAALGDEVHNAVEALGRGDTVGAVSELALPYINSWRAFVEDFRPEFVHLEATCFGTVDTRNGLKPYAGTVDAILRINGQLLVTDYKSGKSVHTEAALQLSALAHAKEIVTDNGDLAAMPAIDGGAVIHLTPTGYAFRRTDIGEATWAVFCDLRDIWDFHVQNLNSRAPLYIAPPTRP
jgi:hypothetical protein